MPYELQALIGSAELLAVAAAEVPVARLAPLSQGLALIPATPAFLAALGYQVGGGEGASGETAGFDWLPDGSGRRLAAWSKAGPIACVEACFFGGSGTQRAAVWADGRLALGPLTSAEFAPFPPEGSPISRALRHLGARVESARADGTRDVDEFEAVGLPAHRSTARWAALA
ncbi:hypothetical protein [Kitasatospora sp. A2-31]|uniref:hypothetical protein n=1 Tax=Kitasatospora sp. A2-31 TaxID=2916414 RepID=UPI001EEB95C9|nr:hypothetical protein [Kitasatospora sp. A2-31]MCG6497355.1 hypothetical protein [Kitasatospora sp. A2-31]MCG6500279.1 hypothetical protein [Kitasatospora sp. A2-31]MCG6500514.1 hypothetical protein [Kitasatospora sp. A2-31]